AGDRGRAPAPQRPARGTPRLRACAPDRACGGCQPTGGHVLARKQGTILESRRQSMQLLNRLARSWVDAGFGRYARCRAGRLDRCTAADLQTRTLLRLVRKAANTRFGRDHGFAAVRTVADYQRLVPLRDYEAFWGNYWQPSFPRLANTTWPGSVPYLALS